MSRLHIGAAFSLPLEAVTQTFALLAKRRAGKSYTARKFAEQLLKARQQIVIVDPKGDWWGIRSAADGKSPGYPVIILGGEHGDLSLEVNAGELIAKLVVEERVSILLDLSSMRKHEVATFIGGEQRPGGRGGFLEWLYRLKARENYRDPMMLIVDEADAIAPQKPYKGEERMLGAIEDIVRRGGQRGIGGLLVSQRSAVLNKNVLTQTQVLVALRTIAEQDLRAIEPWFETHGMIEELKTCMDSLPSLPVGEAWFSSPGWPTDAGIFARVNISPIETFDSGATPKPGEKRREPKNLADVDLDALKRQMSETVERAKQEDPRELRRQNAELRKQLAAFSAESQKARKPESTKVGKPDPERLKQEFERGVKSAKRELAKQLKQYKTAVLGVIVDATNRATRAFVEMSPKNWEIPEPPGIENVLEAAAIQAWPGDPLAASQACVEASNARAQALVRRSDFPAPPLATARFRSRRSDSPVRDKTADNGSSDVGGGALRLLKVLADRSPAKFTRPQWATLAGLAHRGGTFSTYLSRLRTSGLIEQDGQYFSASETGIEALGGVSDVPQTAEEVRQMWRDALGTGPARMIDVLVEHPEGISRDQLAEAVSLDARGGTFGTYLSRLSSNALIEKQGGVIRPSMMLVEGAGA